MLKIYSDQETFLHEKCEDVEFPLSEETKQLAREMLQHLKESQDEEFIKTHDIRTGIGLAAPQIGKKIRMFAVCMDDEDVHYEYVIANPKIKERSAKMAFLAGGEGCLSVDKVYRGLVRRHYRIKAVGIDALTGEEIEFVLKGYPSIAFQHEFDHLNGVLFYDRINPFDPFKVLPNDAEI